MPTESPGWVSPPRSRPRPVANTVDLPTSLGREALSDPSRMRQHEGVDPSKLPRVALHLSQTPDENFLQNPYREFNAAIFLKSKRPGRAALDVYRKAARFPLAERVPS